MGLGHGQRLSGWMRGTGVGSGEYRPPVLALTCIASFDGATLKAGGLIWCP